MRRGLIVLLIQLEALKFRDKQVLRNLMELNMHDQSEYDGYSINDHGLYDYRYIDHYHTDPTRKAYFVRVDGRLAGFVLLRLKKDYSSLAEFFVLRKFRRHRVGSRVAERIFELYPGQWQVSQFESNLPAQAFWRKFLAEYTGGSCTEEHGPDEDFPYFSGPLQRFTIPETTRIYLVRHAHSDPSADERGRPLSPKGESDLARVREIMAGEFIDRVYSSPYKRALQTVEGVADLFGHEVHLREGFRERQLAADLLSYGPEEVKKAWEDVDFCLPGGESNRTASLRGIAALQEVIKESRGKRAAVGLHGTIMTLIMSELDGRFSYEFSRTLSTPDIYRLTFHDGIFAGATRIWL